MCFVDDFSSLSVVYCIKTKSDTVRAFLKFLSDISPYVKVKRLPTDNGTEISGRDFQDFVIKNRIKHKFSCPPFHQNGTVERSWWSLIDMARCLPVVRVQ